MEEEAFAIGELNLTLPLNFGQNQLVLPNFDYGNFSEKEVEYRVEY